jgi:glycosyltransferase involved in cell wall biosynthesis
VHRVHPRTHLILVGAGAMEHELRQSSRAAGVEHFVHILTGVSEVAPVVKHFDVAVLSSATEGLSNAILEYFFCEKPTICTDVGGNPELVVHGETGLLVRSGDPVALADRICQLLSNPFLRTRLAANGRQLAVQRYTSRHMLAAHMHLYDQLLAGGARPVDVPVKRPSDVMAYRGAGTHHPQ